MSEIEASQRLVERILVARCLDFVLTDLATEARTLGPVHSAVGHEWVASSLVDSYRPHDWLIPHYRSHPWFLSWGHTWRQILSQVLCPTDKIGDVFHLQPRRPRMLTASGIVGQHLPVAAGVAARLQQTNNRGVAIAACGDGSLTIGLLQETLVLASQNRLPLVVIVENNDVQNYAMTTAISRTASAARLADFAGCYHEKIEPSSILAAAPPFEAAIHSARSGTPALVDCKIALEHPHLVRQTGEPIVAQGHTIPEAKLVPDYLCDLAARSGQNDRYLKDRADQLTHQILEEADRIISSRPRTPRHLPGRAVFAQQHRSSLSFSDTLTFDSDKTIRGKINELMQNDEGTWICPAGLRTANGPTGGRLTLEAPIAERAMLGVGVGLAVSGRRALVDLGVLNFASVGLDMLLSARPTFQSRSLTQFGGLVVMGAVGTGANVGEQHDWDCQELLCTLPVDRVVVAGNYPQAVALSEQWWPTRETWIVAYPLRALSDKTSTTLTPLQPAADARLHIVAWGHDVRDASKAVDELQSLGAAVAGYQVIDLLNPGLDKLSAKKGSQLLLVASESDGSSVLNRISQAASASGFTNITLERPHEQHSHADIVARAHNLLKPAPQSSMPPSKESVDSPAQPFEPSHP